MNLNNPNYNIATNAIKTICGAQMPKIAIILGSGLGALGQRMRQSITIPYADIPCFPLSSAPGHAGNLLCGRIANVPILALQGRHHRYEGHSFADIIFPVRVLHQLGVETLIVTNAAGGIDTAFTVGDIMLIADHINLMGGNPLVGLHDDAFGERFFDMGTVYTPELRMIARAAAADIGLTLREGVYIAVSGPSYETPAEIRAFRIMGAHAVGMSTVPEVVAARQCGMRVLGLSLITNMAAGVTDAVLSGEEVIAIGTARAKALESLVEGILIRTAMRV
ncbi:MAG: purine-nucleoside phosphorylase [Oscillospiraceae bacterium]|jgi:purine-nucleoside phosphorylase|nr:purine-nucleoside phosphorylase [Oscillospiraceae bacterium]